MTGFHPRHRPGLDLNLSREIQRGLARGGDGLVLLRQGVGAPLMKRRSATAEVPEFVRRHREAIHLAIDSTGLKIMGDGEWHVHKHKTSNKRRSWRKLHLAVDGEGFIVAMIDRIDSAIERFTADGAYDTRAFYEVLHQVGEAVPTIVIPPRRTASASNPAEDVLEQRDAAIMRIADIGRRQWRKEAGAHQQAMAENGMYRYKRLIGNSLRGRTVATQTMDAKIGVLEINRSASFSIPNPVAIST